MTSPRGTETRRNKGSEGEKRKRRERSGMLAGRIKGGGRGGGELPMRSSLCAAFAISLVVVLRLLLPVLPGFVPVEALKEEWGAAAEREEGLVIREVPRMATLGGVSDVEGAQNSAEVEELARFAVEEHNKKEVASRSFATFLLGETLLPAFSVCWD